MFPDNNETSISSYIIPYFAPIVNLNPQFVDFFAAREKMPRVSDKFADTISVAIIDYLNVGERVPWQFRSVYPYG